MATTLKQLVVGIVCEIPATVRINFTVSDIVKNRQWFTYWVRTLRRKNKRMKCAAGPPSHLEHALIAPSFRSAALLRPRRYLRHSVGVPPGKMMCPARERARDIENLKFLSHNICSLSRILGWDKPF